MPKRQNTSSHEVTCSPAGNGHTLIIIGGHEDKKGDKVILGEVARRIGSRKLVVTIVASAEPDGFDLRNRRPAKVPEPVSVPGVTKSRHRTRAARA